MFIFIGDVYLNAEPANLEGLNYIYDTSKDISKTLFIDLGSFSTQILTPEKIELEVKNFFIEVTEDNFPKTVKSCKLEDKVFLIGQDAIDYAKLKNMKVNSLLVNKEFNFNEINTFKVFTNIFNELNFDSFDTVVISNQSDTCKRMLIDFFTNKKVIFIDDTIAQLNSQIQIDKSTNAVIIDVGFETLNTALLCHGFAFGYKKDLKGTKWVHKSISPNNDIDTTLINTEINKEVNINNDDGPNQLYRYFYETLFTDIFSDFLKSLNTDNTLQLIKADTPIYLAGGALDFEGMDNLVIETFKKAGSQYNKVFNVQVIKDSYSSLLKGLASRQL